MATKLPGVVEGSLRGAPSLKVSGRLLACPALHASAEPNSLVLHMDEAQRAERMQAAPDMYYLTDHYQDHAVVLVRLGRIDRPALQEVLNWAWASLRAGKRSSPRKAPGRKD